jgi:putative membrane protein
MSDSSTGTASFEVRATSDSHFAWLRTRFTVERMMMSLVRTTVSLVGFAIVRFFERLQQAPGIRVAVLFRLTWPN